MGLARNWRAHGRVKPRPGGARSARRGHRHDRRVSRRRGSAAAEYAEHPQVLGIKEDNLLEPILSFLARRVFGPERLCLLRDELADATASTWEDHNTELERLQGELREIERSLRRQTLRLEEREDPTHPVVALAIERIEELSTRKAAVTDATQTLKTKRPAGHDPDEILAILDAVPDLRKVLNLASAEQLARIFRAFDVTITYDKPNRRLNLAATITPELIPEPELSPKPEKIPKPEKGDHPEGRSRVGVSIPPPLLRKNPAQAGFFFGHRWPERIVIVPISFQFVLELGNRAQGGGDRTSPESPACGAACG